MKITKKQKKSDNWIGLFYFNRRDPRIIVPKKNKALGWTLNFANPYTYIMLMIIVLIIIIFKYL